MPTLYLIRGVAGSGKSTLARKFVESGLVKYMFEADQYFMNDPNSDRCDYDFSKLRKAHYVCQDKCKASLQEGFSVAISNTSITEKEVAVYKEIAELTGSIFVSIIVENRNDTKNVHDIPDNKIQKMKNRFSIKL